LEHEHEHELRKMQVWRGYDWSEAERSRTKFANMLIFTPRIDNSC